MKLQIFLRDSDGNDLWRDFYILPEYIIGFYIPDVEEDNIEAINLYFQHGDICVKQEPDILEYLTNKFKLI